MPLDLTTPDPSPIVDLLYAFRRSKTMFAAVSLGVFDCLAGGPKSLTEIASEIHAHSETLERLLDACVGLELLRREGDHYENTDIAKVYLTSDSPQRLTGYINYSNSVLWKLWGHLEDAVQEGTHRWQQAYGWDGPIFDHIFKTDSSRREFLMGCTALGSSVPRRS